MSALHRRGLFLRRQIADGAVDDLSPRRASRRRRAAIVDADDDVAGFGQRAMEQQLRAAPRIVDRLPRRLAVDVRDERILLRRVERRRLQHVAIELHALADVDAEELRRRIEQRLHLGDHRGRIGQRAHRLVARQLDHLRQRRLLELRVGVERQLAVRRHVVAMRARLIGRRDALGRAAAVELRSIQIALAGIVRRGAEIHVAGLLVEAGDVRHIGVELRDQLAGAALARHAIDVLEAVTLAQPQEGAAAIDPRHFLDDFDPRRRFIAEHALHRAALDVGGQEIVAILLAIELLDRDRVRIDPADARQIGVARIALRLDPGRRAAVGADHADARR